MAYSYNSIIFEDIKAGNIPGKLNNQTMSKNKNSIKTARMVPNELLEYKDESFTGCNVRIPETIVAFLEQYKEGFKEDTGKALSTENALLIAASIGVKLIKKLAKDLSDIKPEA